MNPTQENYLMQGDNLWFTGEDNSCTKHLKHLAQDLNSLCTK